MPTLPHAVVDTIRRHAARAYPEECCGVLLGPADAGTTVDEARPMANAAARRGDHYTIAPQAMMALDEELARTGRALVGIYHSHPDHPGRPSAADLAAAWPGLSYVIVPVADGTPGSLSSWRLRDDRSRFDAEAITRPPLPRMEA